jgi:hypothetical protein
LLLYLSDGDIPLVPGYICNTPWSGDGISNDEGVTAPRRSDRPDPDE